MKARENHGMADTSEYRIWQSMLTRCFNPRHKSFHRYGLRGITVCPQWRWSFRAFIDDIGRRPTPEHSLDRIDVNGHYEPGNCRWATRQQQAENKRNNRRITIDGVTKTAHEWARTCDRSAAEIRNRADRGKTGEALLASPQTNGRLITFDGTTDTIAGWSRRVGIKAATLAQRLTAYGWTVERALTEGVRKW